MEPNSKRRFGGPPRPGTRSGPSALALANVTLASSISSRLAELKRSDPNEGGGSPGVAVGRLLSGFIEPDPRDST